MPYSENKEEAKKYRALFKEHKSKYKLLEKYRDKLQAYTSYRFLVEVKDKLDHVVTRTSNFDLYDNGDVNYQIYASRSQKFLCVNGPRAGRSLSVEEAGEEYVTFNRNSSWKAEKVPTAVLVWKGTFE